MGGVSASSVDEAATDEKLRAYVRLKLGLASQIRSFREVLRKQGDERRLSRCETLMVKLAEDRFTLAVLGQFKRGKSSLMNSIIGLELLPVGVLPLTSAITILRFGPSERLLIQRRNWSMLQEVPVSRLVDYVTEKGNPGNREQVSAAYLELPLPFLRRGLEFVDTPGIGSSIAANTATTFDYLPQCDAALFVTSAEAPLNQVELEFLREVRRHAAKMFFVVNKIDLLGAGERIEVLDFVRRVLREQSGIEAERVFPVSAQQGLAAKLRGDPSLFARCGLGVLESALVDFLTQQKATIFLASVLDKIAQHLRDARVENEIDRRAELLPEAALPAYQLKLQQQFQNQAASREKILDRLRLQYGNEIRADLAPVMDSFWRGRQAALARQIRRLLGHADRYLGQTASRRVSAALGRLLERAIRFDLWPELMRSLSTSAFAAFPDWKNLRSNLAGISRAGAAAHGIAWPGRDDPELLPPMKAPGLELPLPQEIPWEPILPAPLAWTPARWACERLAAFLLDDGRAWLKESRGGVDEALNRTVNKAFAKWAREVNACAAELERRMQPSTVGPKQEQISENQAALASLQEHLDRLREEIALTGGGSRPAAIDEFEIPPAGARIESLARLPLAGGDGENVAREDLAAGFRIRGCPVCARLAKVGGDFLSKWQYELFASEIARNVFADEFGFCSRHQWQLEAISSPVGISVGQAKLVRRVGRLLEDAARKTGDGRVQRDAVPDGHPCRVCQLENEAEVCYLGRLAVLVRQAAGREAYARSQGLCLHHLNRLVRTLPDGDAVRFILSHQGKRFEEIAEDMESYGMKTEALRRQLRNSDEEDAYWRATTLLVGSRSICLPWPKQDEF